MTPIQALRNALDRNAAEVRDALDAWAEYKLESLLDVAEGAINQLEAMERERDALAVRVRELEFRRAYWRADCLELVKAAP